MYKILTVLFGLVLLIAGGWFTLIEAPKVAGSIKRCTAETEGRVVDVKKDIDIDSDGDSTTDYNTLIEYNIAGTTHTYRKTVSKRQRVGDTYTVRYNPDNVDEIYVKGFDNSPLKTRLMGIISIVLGVSFIWWSVNGPKKKKDELE